MQTTFISKDEFIRRYRIPPSTLRRYLRMLEHDMPKPYSKFQKFFTPAQADFLIRHLCLE